MKTSSQWWGRAHFNLELLCCLWTWTFCLYGGENEFHVCQCILEDKVRMAVHHLKLRGRYSR